MKNKIGQLLDSLSFLLFVRLRNHRLSYRLIPGPNNSTSVRIVGMMRVRNESLVIEDALDHFSQFVDAILVFDDASTDDTVDLVRTHPAVSEVIVSKRWRRRNRVWEETANRRLLLQRGRKLQPEWFFYADADERFEGDIKRYLGAAPDNIDAIRISLFDAYITKGDQKAYERGDKLLGFRKYFGIERRNILMIWRNVEGVDYRFRDSREPRGAWVGVENRFYCQHYGKAISIKQWEDTCRYYADNFPMYSAKWKARMGKAVHAKSDFDTDLYTWSEVKDHGVDL